MEGRKEGRLDSKKHPPAKAKRRADLAGFTLVEIMIVVAIIGVLVAIAIPNFLESRKQARVTRLLLDFTAIEKALSQLLISSGSNGWWTEAEFGQGGNPYISRLVENTELGDFLRTAPSSPVGNGYFYDNDGDTGSCWACAVNLILYEGGREYFLLLDEKVDKGDGPNAGKIMADGGNTISYHIADHSRDY